MRTCVHQINEETLKVPISNVRLGHAWTQWGSCSRRGTISLNTSLLFMPEHVLRYVIIHELAHRRVPSHSAKYWQFVASVCPTFMEDRADLRTFRLCSL
jgi:predicted metal-dependent hydrolase